MKEKIKKLSKSREKIFKIKGISYFEKHLNKNKFFHFGRREVAKSFFIGMFIMPFPLPFQMAIAAVLSIFFRANIPIAVALVWVSNPITMPFIFLFSFYIGQLFIPLDNPELMSLESFSMENISTTFVDIWIPFIFGTFIVASSLSIASYLLVNYIWIANIRKKKLKK